MTDEERAPVGVDVTKPSVARMYDYFLGGKDNFAVDREAAERIIEAAPELHEGRRDVRAEARAAAQENRAFLRRAVRFMAGECGISQFLDIGSGLPTQGNVHEVAQAVTPDARVVYVDNDPIVLAHGRALLATDERTTVVTADMRNPAEVLGHPETKRLIDFSRPVGVLMIAMMHFLTLEERPHVMGALRDALPSGSYLAATHATGDHHPPEMAARIEAVYAATSTPVHFRTRAEILRFFDGFDLVEPGLVTIDAWRPDPSMPDPLWAAKMLYGAVGRKP